MHSLRARVEERDQVRIGEELATVAFVSGVRACVRVCVRACVRASERASVCVRFLQRLFAQISGWARECSRAAGNDRKLGGRGEGGVGRRVKDF